MEPWGGTTEPWEPTKEPWERTTEPWEWTMKPGEWTMEPNTTPSHIIPERLIKILILFAVIFHKNALCALIAAWTDLLLWPVTHI